VELTVVIENDSITNVKALVGGPIFGIYLTHSCPTSGVTGLVDGSHGDSAKGHHQERNRYSFLQSHDLKTMNTE
jgi:hypothetical protein